MTQYRKYVRPFYFHAILAITLTSCAPAKESNSSETVKKEEASPAKHVQAKEKKIVELDYDVLTYSFEQDSIDGFKHSPSSQLTISKDHYKDGAHALLWRWKQAGATIRLETPLPYKPNFRPPATPQKVASIFGAWVYNEKALKESRLRMSFGTGDNENCFFYFGLNFTGWRYIAVKYNDMEGAPNPDMDYIKIEAPTNPESGQVWFDKIQPVWFDDIRWQWPDYQLPFIPSRVPNTLYLNSAEALKLKAVPMNREDQKVISNLKKSLVSEYGNKKFSKSVYNSLKGKFDSLDISKDESGIRGVPVEDIRSYLEMMLEIARQYHHAVGEDKVELERMYVLMSEHMLDQGWAEGSAMKAQHHFGYKSRAWAPAILLMEETLQKHGLLDPMLRSVNWFGRDFLDYTLPFEQYSTVTKVALANRLADYLNTFVNTHLISLVLLEPSAFQAYALRNFSKVLSESILWENGAFKSDGSFFHHKMLYAGYAVPAFNAMASVISNLDGTPYEISAPAYNRLKKALLATELWAYPYWGFAACGRHPITGKITANKSYEQLAVAAPESDAADSDLAELCWRMFGNPLHEKIRAYKATSADKNDGFWSMNYAGLGIYKWEGQSVQLKAYGFGVRSHETYKNDNRFGRYASHGTMLIFTDSHTDTSGINYNGWDWAQPPGATTLALPLDKLEGKASAFYGWSPKQKTVFGGAGHLNQEHGAFGFGLDASRDDQALKVRKSVFAVDGMLICLGSDLTNRSTTYPTVTTLFQLGGEDEIEAKGTVTAIDGTPNQKAISTEAQTAWLIDTQGNGYLLPTGNDDLILQQGLQQSKHDKTKAKTEGTFTKAWLNHGTSPQAAAYEYVVKLGASQEEMEALSQNVASSSKFYEVLQQNENCHAIRTIKGLSFYVVFDSLDADTDLQKGDIRSCDQPLIIVSQSKGDQIFLSITNPSPALDSAYDAVALLRTVKLTIKGRYEVIHGARVSHNSDNKQTVLNIQLEGSEANQFTLKAK